MLLHFKLMSDIDYFYFVLTQGDAILFKTVQDFELLSCVITPTFIINANTFIQVTTALKAGPIFTSNVSFTQHGIIDFHLI